MTSDERRKMLDSFAGAPSLLYAVLEQLPERIWLERPSPGRWSLHEIVVHLADSEAGSYLSCRHLIAEPNVIVPEFDPARWADSLDYCRQSAQEAFEIIRCLRKMTYQLLLAVPDSVWSRPVEYPDKAVTSLECWIKRQERHIRWHVERMGCDFGAWVGGQTSRKPGPFLARSSTQARMICGP